MINYAPSPASRRQATLNMFLLPLLIFATIPSASSVFSSPGHEREVWTLGEKKIVRYETNLTNYTIALWQSDLPGDKVDMGPILAWEQYGPKKEFPWVVQTYGFDLAASNVFFFLIFEGGPPNQGKIGYFESFSSSDFNIIDTDAPSSSEAPKPSTAHQSTIQQPTAQQPTSPQSTSIPSEPTITVHSSQSATSVPPAPTDEVGRGEEPSRPSGNNPTYEESNGSAPSGGLPVGAQAGIGIGVGVFGITCIACGFLWFKYIRKQQRAIAELQERAFSQSASHAQHEASVYKRRSPWEGLGTYLNTKPIEIG